MNKPFNLSRLFDLHTREWLDVGTQDINPYLYDHLYRLIPCATDNHGCNFNNMLMWIKTRKTDE